MSKQLKRNTYHKIGRSLTALLLGLALLLLSVACNQQEKQTSQTNQNSEQPASPSSDSSADTQNGMAKSSGDGDATVRKIGILQLMEHDSLSGARQGFLDGLKEEGYEVGKNLAVDYQNAQGEQANLLSMSQRLVKDSELILAIATPAAQSLLGVEPTQPILFTAVTDPVDAGLVDSLENPGGKVTGTTDIAPLAKQIELLLHSQEGIKTVGLIYNSSEPNSVLQAKQADEILTQAGVQVETMTVTAIGDVQQVLTNLVQKVDGIYIPTDNMLASSANTVGEIAKEYKIPVVTGSIEQVEGGALATYGISYYELGKQTGKQAARILQGEDPANIPVEDSQTFELVVNDDMAKALGIDPNGLKID